MAVAASGTDPASLGSTGVIPRARVRVRWHRPPVPFNIPALILVAGGTVLQMVAVADSVWVTSPRGRLAFSGMREWAKPGYAQVYFSWLALVLVAVTAVFGVVACLHWRGARVFRYLGALLGVAGILLTVGAVLLLAYQSDNETFHLARNYSAGVYIALLGLFASALGAAGGTGHRG
jgi:amino acid transporter